MRHARRSSASSAACGMRLVGERVLDARDLLVVLVALAGQQDHVLRRRRGDASRRWRGRGRPAPARSRVRDRPSRIWPMMASGFSLRGLSLVTTTRSAFFSRHRRHQRALGRVAVAAAAEHAPQLAAALLRQRPQRLQAPCPARRACGRSRPPPAAGPARCSRSMRPGTGSRSAQAATARASGTPIARIAPSTPSRLETLYWPISRVRSTWRSPPSATAKRRPPSA